jgi:hypothetical protein
MFGLSLNTLTKAMSLGIQILQAIDAFLENEGCGKHEADRIIVRRNGHKIHVKPTLQITNNRTEESCDVADQRSC